MDLTYRFVKSLLHSGGVNCVVDVGWAREIALVESGREFVNHYRNVNSSSESRPIFCAACPGWVCYAEKTQGKRTTKSTSSEQLSVLSCLSKVRSPQQIAGSVVKTLTSPSQRRLYHVSIMPCFDKKLEASRQEFITTDDDSQPDIDLVLASNEMVDVLEQLISGEQGHTDQLTFDADGELQKELKNLVTLLGSQITDQPVGNSSPIDDNDATTQFALSSCSNSLVRHAGSGSGGYAVAVLRHAARHLFNIDLNVQKTSDESARPSFLTDNNVFADNRVLVRCLNNTDLVEMLLFESTADCDISKSIIASQSNGHTPYRNIKPRPSTEPLLVFAIANGFRNIQNILLPFKQSRRSIGASFNKNATNKQSPSYPFDYVEVMACPGGCLNGGGQVKTTTQSGSDPHRAYFGMPSSVGVIDGDKELSTFQQTAARTVYTKLESLDPSLSSLRTTYRQVDPIVIVNPTSIHW